MEKCDLTRFPEYDGSDISEACADCVNVHHHYVVLKDYLVYCDERESKIYCVDKRTGKRKEIFTDIENAEEIRACNICGCGTYVYLVHDSGIYRADVSQIKAVELHFVKMNLDMEIKRNSQEFFPQCNEKYLVFLGGVEISCFIGEVEKRILYIVDLETVEARELLAGEDYSDEPEEVYLVAEFFGFKLMGDMLYYNASEVSDGSDRRFIYQYNLTTGVKAKLTELTQASRSCLEPVEHYNDTVGQYGKYIFCPQDKKKAEKPIKKDISRPIIGIQDKDDGCEESARQDCFYDCIDLEKGEVRSVTIQGAGDAAIFTAGHYFYFLQKDSSVERYDILTGKRQILTENTRAVQKNKDSGVFGIMRKTLQLPLIDKFTLQLQLVGKWIYFVENLLTRKICKLQIDDGKCSEKEFRL